MEPLDLVKVFGGGSLAAALLLLIYLVGNRLVAAIDRVGGKIDSHTDTDVEHHGKVREAIIRVEAKIDGVLDERERTPINVPIPQKRARTHPGGAGGYRGAPKRNDDEER